MSTLPSYPSLSPQHSRNVDPCSQSLGFPGHNQSCKSQKKVSQRMLTILVVLVGNTVPVLLPLVEPLQHGLVFPRIRTGSIVENLSIS